MAGPASAVALLGAIACSASGPQPSGAAVGATSPSVSWPAFRFDASHSGVTPEQLLNAGNAATLTAGWTAAAGAASDTSPAVANSAPGVVTVYVGDSSGVLHAYKAIGGAQAWSYKVSGPTAAVLTSPTVFGGDVYFASKSGTLYAVKAATGAFVCSFNTGKQIESSPTVVTAADGSGPVVYIGTLAGGEWAVYGAGNTHGACSKDWFFHSFTVPPGGTWSSAAYGTNALREHVVVFGSKDDDDSVYALDAGTGALVWRYQTSNLSEQDVGSSPLVSAPGVNGIADGAVYVEGKDGFVYALDLSSGSLQWKFKVSQPGLDVSSPSLAGASLLIGSSAGLYGLDAVTGALLWHALTTISVASSPAVTGAPGSQVAFVAGLSGSLYGINVASGSVLWTGSTTTGFYASPAVSHGVVYDVDLGGTLHTYKP